MKRTRHGHRRSSRKLRNHYAQQRQRDAAFVVWLDNTRAEYELADQLMRRVAGYLFGTRDLSWLGSP